MIEIVRLGIYLFVLMSISIFEAIKKYYAGYISHIQ